MCPFGFKTKSSLYYTRKTSCVGGGYLSRLKAWHHLTQKKKASVTKC